MTDEKVPFGDKLDSDSLTDYENSPYFSPSRILKYMGCQAQYKYHYLEGIRPTTVASALSWGSAIHKVIEDSCRKVIAGGDHSSPADMKDLFQQDWEVRKTITTFEEPTEYENLAEYGKLTLEVIRPWILGLHPQQVEHRVERLFPDGGAGVFGFIDLLETTGKISDFKTTKRSPSGVSKGAPEAMYSHRFQLHTYAYCLSGGSFEVPTAAVYIVKTQSPKIVEVPEIVTVDLQNRYYKQASAWIKAIQEGEQYPPNRGYSLCSEKYCATWTKCHEDF
jgi:hypothetical protein